MEAVSLSRESPLREEAGPFEPLFCDLGQVEKKVTAQLSGDAVYCLDVF